MKGSGSRMMYEPNFKSIRKHEVPEWFHDAKFGIFIHWGLPSVPSFAPEKRNILEVVEKEGWRAHYSHNPYAEWYLNSLRIEGSPTQKYHRKKYGKDFSYDDFVPLFNDAIRNWDPNEWADLFRKIGARYVVFVTKHHDGFLQWPSSHPNPRKTKYNAARDVVGELTKAVKDQGLKMGLYYSGALDWSFNEKPIQDNADLITSWPTTREYREYVDAHWRELIDNYEPAILWNDIGYPPGGNLARLFAYFYNKSPEGIVNDRWFQVPRFFRGFFRTWLGRRLVNWISKRMIIKGHTSLNPPHCDYLTPEYTTFEEIKKIKWECTRGIGNSFGYNAQEKPEDHLSVEEVIHMFVDIVSKNGNLLLNVGPMPDGTIPDAQKKCILGLGGWLEANGDAIYGTRPWIKAEGRTKEGDEIRFTKRSNTLYVIVLGTPKSSELTLEDLNCEKKTKIKILELNQSLNWECLRNDLIIMLPKKLPESAAIAFSITPVPNVADK